jgi:hypothetical protein
MSNGLISGVFVASASNWMLLETRVGPDLRHGNCGGQVAHSHQIVSGAGAGSIQCTLLTPRCRTFRMSAIVFSQPKHSSIRFLFFWLRA